MGMSPALIDKMYGYMLPDALDRARSALDTFITTAAEAAERGRSWLGDQRIAALLRSAYVGRLFVVCMGAQMCSRTVGDLDFIPDVLLRE